MFKYIAFRNIEIYVKQPRQHNFNVYIDGGSVDTAISGSIDTDTDITSLWDIPVKIKGEIDTNTDITNLYVPIRVSEW
ncbi:MAG: hypothetical protein J7J51_04035 [Candidatus Omnitrophica bacterium]|nr:hypothetical protein [Candidatus Omnitrophota bacterium]